MTESNDTTRSVKRRGLIAGAAALVVGIAAKGASQPVRAASDTSFFATGGSGSAFANAAGYDTGVNVSGASFGVSATSGGIGIGGSGTTRGVSGASDTGIGVYGQSSSNYGVYGQSSGKHALYGELFAPTGSGYAGVFGKGNHSGTFGVVGDGFAPNTGSGAVGMQGQNAQYGVVGMVNNADNTIAVYGNNTGFGANGTGVVGRSTTGSGVVGETSSATPGTAGGQFFNTVSNGSAVIGQIFGATTGAAAFVGAAAPGNFAGFFTGTVVVQGPLVVTDPSYKSGALAHPDGSHRLVYCVESPESWIEDVGTGQLIGGKATVTFDTDFAAVTHTDTYHVFLTSYDPTCKGLAIATRTPSGFTVQEQNGGRNGGTFSWKVMVKAKSAVKSERLGKFVMPSIKLPDKPPHVPDVPTAPTPPKKP